MGWERIGFVAFVGLLFLLWYGPSRRARWDRQQDVLRRLKRIEQALAGLKRR